MRLVGLGLKLFEDLANDQPMHMKIKESTLPPSVVVGELGYELGDFNN